MFDFSFPSAATAATAAAAASADTWSYLGPLRVYDVDGTSDILTVTLRAVNGTFRLGHCTQPTDCGDTFGRFDVLTKKRAVGSAVPSRKRAAVKGVTSNAGVLYGANEHVVMASSAGQVLSASALSTLAVNWAYGVNSACNVTGDYMNGATVIRLVGAYDAITASLREVWYRGAENCTLAASTRAY